MNEKVALITGASTGLGFEISLQLAARGYKVYATMRNLEKQEALVRTADERNVKLTVKQLDVTDPATIKQCIEDIMQQEETIDLLVNNAGAGFVRTTEQATEEEMMWQINLNLLGVMRMTKAVLPIMRAHQKGHIINIFSVGGLVGQPFNEIYCAAKFGVEGYTESLASYVQPAFNIKFTAIEPGGIKSEFTNNVMAQLQESGGVADDDYKPLLESYLGGIRENYGPTASQTVEETAAIVVNCAEMSKPPIRMRTSEWSEQFTRLKTQADPTGELLQQQVSGLLGDYQTKE